jgi:hypothetical protein
MLPDGLAEAFPVLGVAKSVIKRGPRHSGSSRGDLDPADLQPFHHLGEAAALFIPEQRVSRDPHVGEVQLTALDALVAQLGKVARDVKSLESIGFVDQQNADPAMRWVC